MIRSLFTTGDGKVRCLRFDVFARTRTTSSLVERQFVLKPFHCEHHIARAAGGFQPEDVSGFLQVSEEKDAFTFRNRNTVQGLVVVEFKRCSVVIPNIAFGEFC